MLSNLRPVFVATIVAAGIASPAFAQSPDHTGSQMPSYYDSNGKQTWGSWSPQAPQATPGTRAVATQRSGLHAYAMTPHSHRSNGSHDRTVRRDR
jgi:hypothetical protein